MVSIQGEPPYLVRSSLVGFYRTQYANYQYADLQITFKSCNSNNKNGPQMPHIESNIFFAYRSILKDFI